MQATVSKRSAAEEALLEHPRSRQTLEEVKITTTEATFLPMKSTAESQHAHTSNERNKVVLQVLNDVQLEAQHAEGQHSGYQHHALLQPNLLEPAVESLFTHVGAFSFLFALFLLSFVFAHFPFFLLFPFFLQTSYLLLLNNSYPSLFRFQESELGTATF